MNPRLRMKSTSARMGRRPTTSYGKLCIYGSAFGSTGGSEPARGDSLGPGAGRTAGGVLTGGGSTGCRGADGAGA